VINVKLFIWRYSRIFIAFANDIEEAKVQVLQNKMRMTMDEINYIVLSEPDEIGCFCISRQNRRLALFRLK
jgi:hypothetical protein